MAVISMKELLESGVHFGHRTHKWHPAMKSYIFTERNSIHIIDLQQTVKAIEEAYNLVRDEVAEGGIVLFVGTKRQAQETIQEEAIRAGMPYVTNRWLGGMLTNWGTIRQRINELERLERMRERGDFDRITKKEALNLERQIDRLEYLLGGIRDMTRLPDYLFVVDVRREDTAIHEANLLQIPVIAMVDTNCDPRDVDYVIPSNDDAIRAIKLMVGKIADAVIEGKALRKDVEEEEIRVREVVMPGIEEPELTDEELLGAATLAKISASQQAMQREMEEEVVEEEPVEEDWEEILKTEAEVEILEEEGEQTSLDELVEEQIPNEVLEIAASEQEHDDTAEEVLEAQVVQADLEETTVQESVEEAIAETGIAAEVSELETDVEEEANQEEDEDLT